MGTNSRLILDGQRKLARAILLGLVAVVVSFVLFASGPNVGLSFAQQTASPTSSPTGQAGPFRIEFLNPSGTNFSENVSSKNDGTDTAYHLVAWVDKLPTNATVDFRYFDPDQNKEVTIGTATQTGIPDTFHYLWQIGPEVPEDSEITLYAVLFSGGTEVDRDTESDVYINAKDPAPPPSTDTSDPAYAAVEIRSPAVGGAWGVFTPRDRATAGVLNVTFSDGVAYVRAVYTVSAPGSEPTWVDCGTETAEDAADGVRCTLSSRHRPNQVTGVGAVVTTTDVPELGYDPLFDESGDAHRVQTYEQVPGALTLDATIQDNATTGGCSRLFSARLTDQFTLPIANANIDVHARGPSDEIAFDNGSTASATKVPDRSGHTSEAARDCSDDPPSAGGQQGDHNLPDNDIKHVESASAAGTTDAGFFTFMLFSSQPGVTEFVAWSDLDDDDAFCVTEKSASGSVGWGQPGSASTSLGAEISSCPSPSPTSPQPGPSTPKPTPTPTGTASPPPGRNCTIVGTDGSETIDGTDDDDVICAGDGDDIIRGLGGNDTIYGDPGRDDIRGGAGSDRVHGGGGKDTLRGNDGTDDLFGDQDNDVLAGGGHNDTVDGGGGVDTLRGSGGNDTIRGRGSNDNLTGGGGDDFLVGGAGQDAFAGGKGRDRCVGNSGSDSFRGCEARRQ